MDKFQLHYSINNIPRWYHQWVTENYRELLRKGPQIVCSRYDIDYSYSPIARMNTFTFKSEEALSAFLLKYG